MDFLNKLILPFLLSMVLSSCYEDFEPDIESSPVLCMNSIISPGDTIRVKLSRTWRWSEGRVGDSAYSSGIDVNVYGAEVVLFVNGVYKETLREINEDCAGADIPAELFPYYGSYYVKGRKEYVAEYIPSVGDVVRLEAFSDEYGSASAEVTVPSPVAIDKIEYEISDFRHFDYDEIDSFYFEMDLMIWFTDNYDSTDYYKFGVTSSGVENGDAGDIEYSETLSFRDVSREPLFSEHVSVLESVLFPTMSYNIFSDRQISGKHYPLHIRLEDVSYKIEKGTLIPGKGESRFIFNLSVISPEYYRHVIATWIAENGSLGQLGSVGLAQPVFAFSNVSSGAGVVAAQAPFIAELPVMPIVEEALQRKER